MNHGNPGHHGFNQHFHQNPQPNDPNFNDLKMFAAQHQSRPQSTMSVGSNTPQPQMSNNPFMNILGFDVQNPFNQMMNPIGATGQQNNRVNDWLSWNNIPQNMRFPQSVISQLSLGPAPSQLTFMSQNSNYNAIKQEQVGREDFNFVIQCLNSNFDITETEVNNQVLSIIGAYRRLDKEQTKELLEALWKALANIDYRQLVVLEESKLEPARCEMIDADKQKVLKNLLVLLRFRPHEEPLCLISLILLNNPEEYYIISQRTDPLLDAMVTLQIVCRELNTYNLQQKPRPIWSILRIILIILNHKQRNVTLDSRHELTNNFIREALPLTMRLFSQSVDFFSKNCLSPMLQPPQRAYLDNCGSIIRTCCRLLNIIVEQEKFKNALAGSSVIENLAQLQKIPVAGNKAGVEARSIALKIYAHLSNCINELLNKDLSKPVEFVFSCLDEISSFNGMTNLQEIVVNGTGFLSNVVKINVRTREKIARDIKMIDTINAVCYMSLECLINSKDSQQIAVSSILFTIDNSITLLTQLNHFKDSDSPNALQLKVHLSEVLFKLPCIISSTVAFLFHQNKLKPLGAELPRTILAILKMWLRGFKVGVYPMPSVGPVNNDISLFLLNYFADNIKIMNANNQIEKQIMELVLELLNCLIEHQGGYSQLIEKHLCDVNERWKPFQVLEQLNSNSASLMLAFLQSCSRLERLRQLWAEERDYAGNNTNQQIINRFNQSTDPDIKTKSMVIKQMVFPSDSIYDVFNNEY